MVLDGKPYKSEYQKGPIFLSICYGLGKRAEHPEGLSWGTLVLCSLNYASAQLKESFHHGLLEILLIWIYLMLQASQYLHQAAFWLPQCGIQPPVPLGVLSSPASLVLAEDGGGGAISWFTSNFPKRCFSKYTTQIQEINPWFSKAVRVQGCDKELFETFRNINRAYNRQLVVTEWELSSGLSSGRLS